MALVCGHCQWNSQSIGLTGSKSSIESKVSEHHKGSYSEKYTSLMDQYQILAKEDLRRQELLKQTASQAAHRKGRGLYTKYAPYKREGQKLTKSKLKEKLLERANKRFDEAKNEWVPLEDAVKPDLLPTLESELSPVDFDVIDASSVDDVASLSQRLQNVTIQPNKTADLWPMPTRLLVKRSKRCRVCLHNMIKPELAPDSIRYKMQLFATLHVPNVTLLEIPEFKVNKAGQVHVQVANPLDQAVEITLAPRSTEGPVEAVTSEAENPGGQDAGAALTGSSVPDSSDTEAGASRPKLPPMSTIVREKSKFDATAQVKLPTGVIKVAEHDPVHEYQPEEASAIDPDEERDCCIVKRQGNRVVLALEVTPQVSDKEVAIAFQMEYKYKVTTTGFRTEKSASTVVHDVVVPVEINFASIAAEA